MANYALKEKSPLLTTSVQHDGCELRQVRGQAIASLAAARGDRGALARALDVIGITLAEPGTRVVSGSRSIAAVGHQQWFVSADNEPTLATDLANAVNGSGYVTDQTGGWIEVRLTGPRSRAVLERICTLDLHPDVFTVGTCARTTMEHLSVQIALLDDAPTFALTTPSSSARSFWTAMEHALASACGPEL